MSDILMPQVQSFGPPPIKVHIRWMIRRDLPEVLAIERRSFNNPWAEEDFILFLRTRNSIGMVAEHDDRVVGFMLYEVFKTRFHIENLAVHRDWQRRKVGLQLVGGRVKRLSVQRRTSITIHVRETNLLAQRFFHAQGFRAVSVLHDWYEDTPEDAYLMRYDVRSTERDIAR